MTEKQNIVSYPDLLEEWDWENNSAIGLHPEGITLGSVRKIYWKCKLGHQWEATPNNRSRGQGCPVCAGRKIEIGFNDLASRHPTIASNWHPQKMKICCLHKSHLALIREYGGFVLNVEMNGRLQ